MGANRFTFTVLLASLALAGCSGAKDKFESGMRAGFANTFKASCEAGVSKGLDVATVDPEALAKANRICACTAEKGAEELSIEKITQLMKGGEAEVLAAFEPFVKACFAELGGGAEAQAEVGE